MSSKARSARGERRVAVVVKNRVTPKLVCMVNGMDKNLRSNSWWFNFDPYPCGALFEGNPFHTGLKGHGRSDVHPTNGWGIGKPPTVYLRLCTGKAEENDCPLRLSRPQFWSNNGGMEVPKFSKVALMLLHRDRPK